MLTKEDAEGRLILSKKRARFELAWKAIEGAAESGQPVIGRVIEVVKGGLILDLGVRGFLPASLVDIRRVQDLDEFMGKELRCKVIELNRSRNNVVLSRRAVLEDERKEMRQAILDRLNPGDVVDGQISNIVDFGAFVDLDGMDGLIHISELSWSHVNHPSEVLEIGQDVKVKVLDIDRERQRISLGLKQTQSDPWQQVARELQRGRRRRGPRDEGGHVRRLRRDPPGVEGLVHISELAQHHVENPREVVSQGDVVNVLILEIDAERRRLSLSLKRVEEGEAVQPRADGPRRDAPELDLSEEVFAEVGAAAAGPRTRRSRWARPLESEAEVEARPWPRRTMARGGGRGRGGGRVGGRGRAEVAEGSPPTTSPRSPRPRCRARGGADGPAEAASSRRRLPTTRSRRARQVAAARSRSRSPAGSAPARARRLKAFARHGAATSPSDEIVHRLLREDEGVRRRSSSGSARASWTTTARSIARASPRSSSATATSCLARGRSCIRSSSREYLDWREELSGRPDPPACA